MMPYNPGAPGLGYVGAYQVSAKPFVTGGIDVSAYTDGPLEISFPSVTRWIIVKNLSNPPTANAADRQPVYVAASATGFENALDNTLSAPQRTGSYITINDNYTGISYQRLAQTPRLELKLTKLYLTGAADNVEVIAGLTGIPTSAITNNWSGSEGVG
jgi:hypothetical protein